VTALRLLGLDLSLTATGEAHSVGNRPPEVVCHRNAKDRGVQRLHRFRGLAERWAEMADLVVLEGYSYGSPAKAHDIGEMGGVVRLFVWYRRTPLVVLSPTQRARLATGKGNAKKEAVLVEAVRRLGYQGADNNEADALWLLEAARQHYGVSDVTLPAAHLTALAGVVWPELTP